ncbi:hypothetical protein LZ480_07715 [Solibacillus sp. MA9]|uniref:Phage protein n=1 Tax=Solibacillus palustris TaxID=2908203 RepID=A0ABS9UBS2_9BACL|nr:hypothetical protein [Solibacillus sp. MA9]MCH7321779.1 hypothetical protein [Solibacillus sp. MA9]
MVSARRKALERLWKGECTVIAWQEVEDPITFVTEFQEVILHENLKCKLSHKTISATSQTGAGAILVQQIKLSLGNEFEIPAGCKITVTQNGKTADYARSGEPGMFIDHQEIVLDIFGGYA